MASLLLSDLVATDDVVIPLGAGSADEVLRELAHLALRRGVVRDDKQLVERLLEREALGSTAVGERIAVPHAKVEGLPGVWLAIGVSTDGIRFGGKDGGLSQLFFLVLSSPLAPSLHIRLLAQVSRVARAPGLVEALVAARDPAELRRTLEAFERGPGR